MSVSKPMTADEFERDKYKLRKLSANTNELARLILVEGMTTTQAAETVGMSPQNVSKHMRRVKALLNDMPSDFVWFEGFMPETMAVTARKEIKAVIDRFKEKSGGEK